MSEPVLVAHIMGHMMGGGVEATVMNYYRHIDHHRVQFDFLVDSDSTKVPYDEIERFGGKVFVVPPYRELPKYLKACKQIFNERKPNIVHSHINALSVFPLSAAKQAGIPVRIAHSHSTANPKEYGKTLVKNILRPFSKVEPTHLAACSEHAARWLFGDATVDAGNVHIINNAIDLKRFTFDSDVRRRKRIELNVHRDQFVIGQVGRICFQKNPVFTLCIFKELLKKRPDAILLFVGDGALMHQVQGKVSELGLEESVRFLGVRDDIAELYQAFDALVLPSMYEGFGMAAVEAQTTGLPVIISDQVPNEVCIVPGIVHICPLADPSSWTKTLCEIDTSDSRMSDISLLDSAGYDIDNSAKGLCAWYEALVKKSSEAFK